MKAFTKYNDFEGTSAADFEEREDTIKAFFQAQGGDINRFEPIGTSFYLAPKNSVGIKFFCVDKTKPQTDEPYIIQFDGKVAIPFNEYFRLFKSLTVVLVQETYKEYNVSESLYL